MVSVKLIFVRQFVDLELISRELGVQPDEDIEREKYSVAPRKSGVVTASSWTFSQISTSEEDVEWGVYKEWCKFLLEKSSAIEKLSKQGYEGYLEISLLSSEGDETCYRDSAFIDSTLVEILGRLKLGISLWSRKYS
ncbi:MAG TPA: hypothetical protein V6C86_17540 [Oculatellaceae cyanobacterium]